MATQLRDVFNITVNKIEEHFKLEGLLQFEKEKELHLSKTSVSKLQDKLTKLKSQKQLIDEQIRELENQISNADRKSSLTIGEMKDRGKINNDEYTLLYEYTANCYSRHSCSEMDVKSVKTLLKTKAGRNFVAWKAIRENFTHMFNLAITPKQQQQVVMQLQSTIDWNSLGIDIPTMFKVDKIEIEDGLLVLNNALPDLS